MSNCFLLFFKLLAAHNLLKTDFMRDDSDIQIVCGFRFFNKKLILFKFSQHQWTLLFEIIVVCTQYVVDLFHEKGFFSVSLFPFTKKMTSPWLIITSCQYCFLFRFVAMSKIYSRTIFLFQLWIEEELWGFICRAKMTSPPLDLHGPKR